STVAGLMVTRTGRYRPFILSGLATMVVAFALTSTMGPSTPIYLTVLYSVLLGLGLGPTNSLFVLAVQNALPANKLGTVTSANMFFRQIGGTIGVAVFGAMVAASTTGFVEGSLPAELSTLPPAVVAEFASPNLLTSPEQLEAARAQVEAVASPAAFTQLVEGLRSALSSGLGGVFLVGAALALIAFFTSFRLPTLALRTTIDPDELTAPTAAGGPTPPQPAADGQAPADLSFMAGEARQPSRQRRQAG